MCSSQKTWGLHKSDSVSKLDCLKDWYLVWTVHELYPWHTTLELLHIVYYLYSCGLDQCFCWRSQTNPLWLNSQLQGKKTQQMTGSTDSLLTRETVLLINKMNTYKWFSSMEDEDHHFPPDLKSFQGCQNLTSHNIWST